MFRTEISAATPAITPFSTRSRAWMVVSRRSRSGTRIVQSQSPEMPPGAVQEKPMAVSRCTAGPGSAPAGAH